MDEKMNEFKKYNGKVLTKTQHHQRPQSVAISKATKATTTTSSKLAENIMNGAITITPKQTSTICQNTTKTLKPLATLSKNLNANSLTSKVAPVGTMKRSSAAMKCALDTTVTSKLPQELSLPIGKIRVVPCVNSAMATKPLAATARNVIVTALPSKAAYPPLADTAKQNEKTLIGKRGKAKASLANGTRIEAGQIKEKIEAKISAPKSAPKPKLTHSTVSAKVQSNEKEVYRTQEKLDTRQIVEAKQHSAQQHINVNDNDKELGGMHLETLPKNRNSIILACINSNDNKVASQKVMVKSKARARNEEAIEELIRRIPEIKKTFDVHCRIGNGTFSTVLLATLKRERNISEKARRRYAIKHHIPTSHPDRIMKELQCMTKMGGVNNVVGINCCIRCDESVAFIMPYMAHDRFYDFYAKMSPAEIAHYMRNLLIALRHVHKFKIIHRDVKPSNFLYNRQKQEFLLVDFGLAQHVPKPAAEILAGRATQEKVTVQNLSGRQAGQYNRSNKRNYEQMNKEATPKYNNAAKRARVHEDLSENVSNKMPLKQLNDIKLGGKSGTQNTNDKTLNQQQNPAQPNAGSSTNPTSSVQPNEEAPLTKSASHKYNVNRASKSNINNNKCLCSGNPTVCNTCLVKKEIHASRAGTPGYRPPEVLLKYIDQTTAVDIWAAGVIFLSLLSSVYPFFKAPNDYIALAEIITIFGDSRIRKTACTLERTVTISQKSLPLDLHKLCVRFRNRLAFSAPEMFTKYQQKDGTCPICKNCDQYFFNCLCLNSEFETEPLDGYDIFPPCAYDLLARLLEVNPHKRITADEALRHPFLREGNGTTAKTSSN